MADDVSRTGYWEERWRSGRTGWDLGGPCPVLVDLLASGRGLPHGRVAVPGSGSGHDLRLLLEHGYDAVGFDFAHAPGDLPVERLDVLRIGERHPAAFDAIFEYTCYCAIDPSERQIYARALHDALRPGGTLVAVLFPVEPRDDGPPFGVDEAEIAGVLGRDLEVESVEVPRSSAPARLGRERLAILRRPA